jgi:hypothetical protein
MLVNPHKCKISLALDDQGEIVPRRGMIIICDFVLSQFKQNALNQKLSKVGVELIGTEFVHFAHCKHKLNDR